MSSQPLIPPCRYCRGQGGERRPCADGFDRCEKCLERLKASPRPVLYLPGVDASRFSIGVGLEQREGRYVVAGHPDGKDHSDAISVATPRKPDGAT